MPLLKKYIIGCCFFISLVYPGLAQQPFYKNYLAKDGLPSNMVYHVFQDSKGFIWFATDVGLSKFDGKYFENYTVEDGLPDNEIFNIFEDSKGKMWYTTYNGRPGYRYNDTFHNPENDQLLRGTSMKSLLTSISEDAAGNILIGSKYDGINVHGENSFERLKIGYDGPISYIWNKGNVLFGVTNQFIFKIDKDKQFKKLFHHQHIRQYLRGYTNGEKTFICAGNHLLIFDNYTEQLTRDFAIPEIKNEIIFISKNKDDFWLGTRDGAYKLSFTGIDYKNYSLEKHLEGHSISSILIDKEENIWFSTLESGVFFAPSPNILHYTTEDGLPNDKILCLEQDLQGRLWMGSIKNYYAILENGKINSYRLNGISSLEIPHIHHYKDESWIIGKAIFQRIKNDKIELVARTGSAMIRDSYGNYWIGQGNIIHYTPEMIETLAFSKEETVEIQPLINLMGKAYQENMIARKIKVISFEPESDSTILVASNTGVYRFSYDADSVTYNPSSPILPYKTNYLKIDHERNIIWASTYSEGVFALQNDSILFSIKQENGLSSNICTRFFIDEASNVWVGTVNGLNKIEIKNGKYQVTNLSKMLGLGNIKVNDVEVMQDTIYVATEQGVTLIPLSLSIENKLPPQIYLTAFSVNDKSYLKEKVHSFLYDKNSMKFNFLGLAYKDQGNVRYKYRLKGQDDTWEYSEANFVQYKSLAPSEYSFEVKAINGRDVESLKPAVIRFTIDKPFWRKAWFILGLLGFVISMILTIWKSREKNLKRKYALEQRVMHAENEKLEIEKNFLELEMRALRLQMNPHFIFNALNTIKGYYSEAKIREANSYISKFARLLRLIMENPDKYISLEKEIQVLTFYMDLSAIRYPGKFSYEIKTAPEINSADIAIPPMLLQPFVENAIIHGLAPKPETGKITITFKKEGQMLLSEIEDDGIGREAAKKTRRHLDHKSKGIETTRERLKIINRGMDTGLTFQINDLVDPAGYPAGTLVTIKTPFKKIW